MPAGVGWGHPAPLGLSLSFDGAANFAMYSKGASGVVLCLYDGGGSGNEPALEIELDPYVHRTGDVASTSRNTRCPAPRPGSSSIVSRSSFFLLADSVRSWGGDPVGGNRRPAAMSNVFGRVFGKSREQSQATALASLDKLIEVNRSINPDAPVRLGYFFMGFISSYGGIVINLRG